MFCFCYVQNITLILHFVPAKALCDVYIWELLLFGQLCSMTTMLSNVDGQVKFTLCEAMLSSSTPHRRVRSQPCDSC
jgi:hypothetical protein